MANVLLLQGPFGPFFRRLARDMEADGVNVHKVNFNAGDALFFRHKNSVNYRGKVENWPVFLERLLDEREIDQIYLFGDYRIYHKLAIKLAKAKNIKVYVMEEGYLRPDYITVEEGGMHCNSSMPRDANFYLNTKLPELPKEKSVGRWISKAVIYGGTYYLVSNVFSFAFPHYRHHRGFNFIKQGSITIVKGVLYLWNRFWDRRKEHIFSTWLSGKYFLVALQVRDDSSILQNSEYKTVSCFIKEVIRSFAENADSKDFLVIKHHPFDTSFRGYAKLIQELKDMYELGERVIYIHHISVPMLLKNAKGTVVVNSTVGMSSIHHGTPVKVLGQAIYNFEPLSYAPPLDKFWQDPGEVNEDLYEAFRSYICWHNQVNGNFYNRVIPDEFATGCVWRERPWVAKSTVSESSLTIPEVSSSIRTA